MTESLYQDGDLNEPVTQTDLSDGSFDPGFDFDRVDPTMLRHPLVVRALAVIAVSVLVLLWPERTDNVLSNLVGLGMVAVFATSGWAALRAKPRPWLQFATALAGVAVGVFLIVAADRSEVFLSRLLGWALVIVVARDLYGEWNSEVPTADRRWSAARSFAIIGVALLLILFPSQMFSALLTTMAIAAIAVSALLLTILLDRNRDAPATDNSSASRLVSNWLFERPKTLEDRRALYRKIIFDGSHTGKRVTRFFTLMTFASVIASMGVITDSTAVVIGAMLIAPLMTPLMGMALSLVMGWPRRLGRSALIAFGGIGVAIGIGLLLGLTAPTVIDVGTNSQILSRATPTVLDLITAVAAGAAGAYGLSRPDVSDSLPGVAIAISLVPPLTAVGISYSQGEWAAGNGALLLFATNMLAILIIGALTFVFTGVAPIERLADNQQRVRTAVGAVAGVAAIVLGSLMLNSAQIAENLLDESSVEEAVDEWIEPYNQHSVVRVNSTGDTVVVAIIGPAAGAPSASDLAQLLGEKLDKTATADVRLIVEERDVASSGP